MRWLLTAAALALLTPAAPACINDREVEKHEREFKSQYLAPRPAESPSPEPIDALPIAAAGGGVLLLGAAVFVLTRSSPA
jgi:hypothetical protein